MQKLKNRPIARLWRAVKFKLRIRTRLKATPYYVSRKMNKAFWVCKLFVIEMNTNRVINHQLSGNIRIPKVIHYIWVGGAKKPASVERYIQSWRKYCPDYEIIEWNEHNYNISSNNYTNEAYKAKKWAFVTDYMRLDILDRFGGIYMDSDVEVLKNLDVFLDKPAFSSFEAGDPSEIFLPTGIMASEKGGSWVKYLKSYYSPERSFYDDAGQIDMTTNTATITKMTVDRYGIKLSNKLQVFNDFVMYPSEYFCPKSWSTGKVNKTEKTYTIHHFAGSWVPHEVRKLQNKPETEL